MAVMTERPLADLRGLGYATGGQNSFDQAMVNLSSVKRFDSDAIDILFTASQVALYEFQGRGHGKSWSKVNVEGVLFLYKRSSQPENCILLMNRLNKDNLQEPIVPELELQVINQFLLYRSGTNGKIYGIWIHKKEELMEVARLVRSLSKVSEAKSSFPASVLGPLKNGVSCTEDSQVDVIKLLQKAHAQFEERVASQQAKSSTSAVTHMSNGEQTEKSAFALPRGQARSASPVTCGQHRRQRTGRGSRKANFDGKVIQASGSMEQSSIAPSRNSTPKAPPSCRAAISLECEPHAAVPVACSPLASSLPKPERTHGEPSGRTLAGGLLSGQELPSVTVQSNFSPQTGHVSTLGSQGSNHHDHQRIASSASAVRQAPMMSAQLEQSHFVSLCSAASIVPQPSSVTAVLHSTPGSHQLQSTLSDGSVPSSLTTPDRHVFTVDTERSRCGSGAEYASPVGATYSSRTFSTTSSPADNLQSIRRELFNQPSSASTAAASVSQPAQIESCSNPVSRALSDGKSSLLMSPMDFQANSPEKQKRSASPVLEMTSVATQTQQLPAPLQSKLPPAGLMSNGVGLHKTDADVQLSLNLEQVQQGLVHLLKTDHGFVEQLHKAYLDSLSA